MKTGILVLAMLSSGCTYALKPHVPAFERTFRLHAADPGIYSIRVQSDTTKDFPVAPSGEVHIIVPASPRACDRYLFGKINLHGSGWPRVYVLKSNRKTKELSPIDLFDTTANKEGVYDLHIE